MGIGNYRVLVSLRHVAESIDEVNAFLARGLEVQLRLQKQGAIDRIVAYLGGSAAAVAAAFSIGGKFFNAGLVLAAFFLLMLFRSFFYFLSVEKQRKELISDHTTVKDYFFKATRDRLGNGVTHAIQNRRAANKLLEASTDLDEDDRSFLIRNAEFWDKRILSLKKRIEGQNEEVWADDIEMHKQMMDWIDTEEVEINERIKASLESSIEQ